MKSSLYRPVVSPVSLKTEILPNPPKHLEISTRGMIFQSEEPIEAGTTLHAAINTVSMTGSLECTVKVLKCQTSTDGNGYDVYANFYGLDHETENEILEFISKT
ncbi:MAG: hypothetical protein MH321_00420 [Leptospiraceae bacterium]|nr:hypothetical protein [Leptospiraceae bacterium]